MNGGNGEVKLISLQYNDENFCPENNLVTIDYSWLGESNPHSKYSFNSLIGDASEETGQKAIINQYQLFPFKMNVLDPFRTFCEKIMSLVRFSYSAYSAPYYTTIPLQSTPVIPLQNTPLWCKFLAV